jgi:predicted O-methyltransferase YrrM
VNGPAAKFVESSLGARARMAAALARLSLAGPAARPLRRALRATLLGRLSSDERAWSERIEARRAQLIQTGAETGMPAFRQHASGGGEFEMSDPQTTLGFAAVVMSLTPEWCLLLMRLVRELAPRSCLELGTGFGISTAYQAAALTMNGSGRLTTLEGSAAWADLAIRGLAELDLQARVSGRVGPLAETLAAEAERRAPVDFVFVDAEHEVQPTLEHFEAMLPHLAERAVLVFDDVDWPGVRAAHDRIAGHESVTESLRLGRLGVTVVQRRPAAPA